jgi:HAE1 family hydrophobic/amphiphilic exporter-1
MLVDNAVVVLESIFRRREDGEEPRQAARAGATEVAGALVGVTLTTVAVFLPVVFVEGFAAQLFRDQAITVSISILVSLAVALTFIPMVAARSGAAHVAAAVPREEAPVPATGRRGRIARALAVTAPRAALRVTRRGWAALSRGADRAVGPITRVFDAGLGRVLRAYPVVLGKALDRPWLVLGIAGSLFAVSLLGATRLGVDLIPSFSQGEFNFEVELPEGTPLEVTDRSLRRAQDVLAADGAVESFSTIVGGAGLALTATGTEGENFARIDVRMKPGLDPGQELATIASLRGSLATLSSARVKFQRPSYFSFRTPVEVEVYSDQLADLHRSAAGLQAEIAGIAGLVDVRSSAELGNPELQVRFDRDALARMGLDPGQVAAVVRQKVRGEVATRFNEGDREIDIVVRSANGEHVGIEEVQRVIVDHREGRPVYLSAVARVTREMGPSEIRRIGQRRAAVIGANLGPGRSLGAAADEIRDVLERTPFPASVLATLSGQEEERRKSFASLMLAVILSLFLVYLVMAAEFESLLHPLVIFFTVPLAAIGVVGILLATGLTVNVVVLIGVVMLGGIVVNNAIVLIDAVKTLRSEGLGTREALLQGGRRRLRPILMTTATTALGLLPMALGFGDGAELRAPLAITVIGGLLVSTLLTLVVVPVVYLILDPQRAPRLSEAPDLAEAEAAVPAALPAS